MSPFRCTEEAPSGIFCPGSVMIVKRMPRAIACSIFFPRFSRISENVGVAMMDVSVDWSISSPIFSRTRGFVMIVYTSWGSPFARRTSWSRSSLLNVSSKCSTTRPLALLGASGLKIVGRPRVEIANPFWHRLCKTLYADVRGIRAVSAIVSALPYPWATSAMYPRASYPERPIDSSVFVARSNSCSRSTPPARSFDKSCVTTAPRYSMAVYIFSNGGHAVRFRNATQAFIRREPSFAVMGSARPAGLAVVAFFLLFWSVFTPAVGQNPVGHMVVTTDYELFGTSDLSGGGHVTWTLTGAKAGELRAKILNMFDTYGQIPRGFPFEGTGGTANGDGVLAPLEGVRYTDLLENVLEGSGGTRAQYMQLYPFDLREQNSADPGLGSERSTSGLANANRTTSGDVEIRFLFEASTSTRSARVSLPTPALAESLYRVFNYEAVQSPTLTAAGVYPGSWPFLVEGGWHIVTTNSCPSGVPSPCAAFWAGNNANGTYANNTAAVSDTTGDNLLAASSPIYVPFDLRFATEAWATFNYTGQVADAQDQLKLEISTDDSFMNWTNLFAAGLDHLPQTPLGAWSI